MMNGFESRWFIAIIGEVYRLVWNGLITFILVQQRKFPSITKKSSMVLQDLLSAVNTANNL